ncbi:MAG: hypothetical protein IKH78_08415 [Ruminococcus sp.]|nr:hypothetical protein [Ruminococcus sp.]
MDKKLKKAADRIKMPDDVKERIIKACEAAEEKKYAGAADDSYTEVVSGTERIDTKRNMIRIVSAIAACAVLISGLGATGVLLHRQRSSQTTGSGAVDDASCRSCPFGDFTAFEYKFDGGDGKYGNYSAETYAKLSDFLNKFNWGSELTEYETRTEEQDAKVYHIKWTRGDTPPIDCDIYISVDGFVNYQESMMGFESGAMENIGSKCYKIDLDAFDRGVQEILAQADAPTPFGDFSKLDYILNANDAKYGELSDDVRANLSDFLNNFNWGEEISDDQLSEEEKNRSQMNLHSLEWRSEDKNYGLAVMEIGYAVYNVQKVTNVKGYGEVLEPESVQLYRVDYEAFDRGIQAVLNNEPLEKELSKCEDSPFADILSQSFLAAPFAIENVEMTAEQRNNICSIFDSQTWYEFDGRGEYFGWIITPNRNNFTITCNNGSSVDVISVKYPDIACIYSRTYDENGYITEDDWRFYKCGNKNICAELAEVFGSDLGFRDVDIEEEQFVDPALDTEKNILDVVHDKSYSFTRNYWKGDEWMADDLTAEQKQQLISFFETYELKDEDLVPDMWKGYGSEEFEELFGSSIIMISSEECVEKDISVSEDMQYIALYSPSHYNGHGYDTRFYRLHDAENIKDIYNIINGIE